MTLFLVAAAHIFVKMASRISSNGADILTDHGQHGLIHRKVTRQTSGSESENG
jgi:hypothetical protein